MNRDAAADAHHPTPVRPRPTMVCFDWGGVILRHCHSWEEGCRRAGLPERPVPTDAASRSRRLHASHEYGTGRLAPPDFFRALADSFGGVYSIEECRVVHHAWLIDEYEGIDEVLERLARVPGVETGLLSNTTADHWIRHLEPAQGGTGEFRAIARLKHRHASHLLGLLKPDPAIYREFERATGHAGHEILFFDNKQENVDAARSVGWRAAFIDHDGHTPTQIAIHLRAHGIEV